MSYRSLKLLFVPMALLIFVQTGFAQSEDDTDADFTSPERLIEIFMADENQAVEEADAAVLAAEGAVDDATEAVTTANDAVNTAAADSQELIDAQLALEQAEQTLTTAEQGLVDAQANLEQTTTDIDEEAALVTELVGKLSEDQIFAFNRSLNNSLHNQFPVDLDADILQIALDGEYDKTQINFLTKAYEEEAKFLSLAEKFKAKAEETGDDKYIEKADRMTAKAQSSKEKFLDRVDQINAEFGQMDETEQETRQANHEASSEARNAAQESASEARTAAKEAAMEARDAAKEAAREAREVAKENARENARENSRGRNGD